MVFSLSRWLKITLINLFIVACLGVTLRYKILYSLPFIDQKHLLHGHSHFAFAGWITQAIMALLVSYLIKQQGNNIYKKYKWLLYANLFTAYGMLIAFPIEGYGLFSIIFSTASIFVSYFFAFFYWRDLNKLARGSAAHAWFKAAVLFNAVSSVGAFALTIMMVARVIHQTWYLAAEYFYLHFQYNGWFFFACMGLFTAFISRYTDSEKVLTSVFRFFVLAIVPAYFLSALWMDIPVWVYILVILAALSQVIGWLQLVHLTRKNRALLNPHFSTVSKYILVCSAVALSVKLLLQLGSTIPSLSNLAFSFRPIVIGYLHLVLLGVITLFLLGSMFSEDYFYSNKRSVTGVIIFAGAVMLNEILLMVQGVAAITYTSIPFINEMLLGAALLLFTGALLMSLTKINNLQK
ncbi:MAG: hypothetical protein IPL84_12480 [Chitinophagaceae bacterium]|nr:hypothetical protein [Chitinophagaceae bacterium]